MKNESHRQLTLMVYSRLQKLTGIRLDVDAMLTGSIAPDVQPRLVATAHMIQLAMPHLMEFAARLTRERYESDIKGFSHDFAALLHYCADFFCKAHNTRQFANVFWHQYYELTLEKAIFRIGHLRAGRIHPDAVHRGSVVFYLQMLNERYMKERRWMRDDVNYALRAMLSVGAAVLAVCSAPQPVAV